MASAKIEFVHTSKALCQLENQLNCCICVCCEAFLGKCCPICDIPGHVKDAEVDRQLHNLATLCYRLRRVLSGGQKSQEPSIENTDGNAQNTPTPGSALCKNASRADSARSEESSATKQGKNRDPSSDKTAKKKTRRSTRGSGTKNQSDPVTGISICQSDCDGGGGAGDGVTKSKSGNGSVKSKLASRKSRRAQPDPTTTTKFYERDKYCDGSSHGNTGLSVLDSEKEMSVSEELVQTTTTLVDNEEEEEDGEALTNKVSGTVATGDNSKGSARSQKRKSQDEACSRKRTRLRHSLGGHEAGSTLLAMSESRVESEAPVTKSTPSASRQKRSSRNSRDSKGAGANLGSPLTEKASKSANAKDVHHPAFSEKKSTRRRSISGSLTVGKTEGRGVQKDKVSGFALSKLAKDRVASPAIDKRNAKGETALQVAAIKNDVDKVQELLSAGANPNVRDNAGWTPLHEACNHGYLEVATLLLDGGAMINVPGLENDTALHDAISNNRLDCVRFLVSRGASLTIRNMHGKTASDLAVTDAMKKALNTPVTAPTVTPNTQPLDVLEYQPPCLLGTGLSREGKVALQKAASQLNVKLADEVTPEVTHIVTKCNAEGMCPRTIKLLHGVLMGKWIVNTEWLATCMEVGSLVCEEAFEVQGTSLSPYSGAPNKGRMNRKHQLPGLFNGCQFYFHGGFEYATPSKEELVSLVKAGDGQLLTREPKPGHLDDLTLTVPYHSDPGSEIGNCSVFIVHENQVKFQPIRTKKMCSVRVSWIMDCASNFRLVPLPEK